jgi:hypothetical protein
MIRLVKALNASVNDWFTASEADAAGRLGLFRVLFSGFYLWHLSTHFAARLSGLPTVHGDQIVLIKGLPESLSPVYLELLESVLVMALVMLMFGYYTRLATAVVLATGCVLEALYTEADSEHATVFLAFYIPLFMLLNGRWGHTYSMDALCARRSGDPIVRPGDPSWLYFWPARAALVILSVLYFSGVAFKVLAGGTWLERPDLIANIWLESNIKASVSGLPLNPSAPFVATHPIVYNAIRYQVILFEATFILSLFNRRLRDFYLSLGLIFHSINALWLTVTFTPVLIVYALFVDWQALRKWLWPRRIFYFENIPLWVLICLTVGVAVAAGALWNATPALRTALNLGGVLNWRTIWYPILPLAGIWFTLTIVTIIRSALDTNRRRKTATNSRLR